MAVRPNNVRNSRKAVMWDERDDAQLAILLRRKIKDTSIALRESETPYERSRLKAQRERYKSMLHKVEKGAYNGDIIFNELRASAALKQEMSFASGLHSSVAGGKKYTNSYGNMDFDYEAAFRKKRYYGAFLPILMTLLTIILIASLFIGAFSPSLIGSDVSDSIESSVGININAMFVYRLGDHDGEMVDIAVKADDNGYWFWPEGNYKIRPEQGKPYEEKKAGGGTIVHDGEGETVSLYKDLGCTEIYIDAIDIIKAWFKTKMLEKTRIDVIEDLEIFQGQSFYYALFLSGTKADELVIAKNDEGKYDFGVIYNHIGVYGTIIFLLLTIIFSVILLIQNIVRIFTYTSRRIHVTTLLTLIFGLLTFISPVLATCEGTDIASSFMNFFNNIMSAETFLSSTSSSIGATILSLAPIAICILLLILPKLFKNRYKNMPSQIPKGNAKIRMS